MSSVLPRPGRDPSAQAPAAAPRGSAMRVLVHGAAAAARLATAGLDATPALPHMEPDTARLSGWLACRAAAVPVRAGGHDWQLRFVPADPEIVARPGAGYAFTLGSGQGVLRWDVPSERLLLGIPGAAEALPALLRHALMADALAEAVAALGHVVPDAFNWQPEGARTQPLAAAHAFGFELRRDAPPARLRGTLQLDQPERLAALPAGVPAQAPAWMERLPVPVAVRIGTTRLALGEMHGIEPGDIVGIDDWHSQGSALVVRCTTGRHGPDWTALAEGRRLVVQAGAGSTDVSNGAHMEEHDPARQAQPIPHPDAAQPSLSRLDQLEVTLRFEVGDVAVPLAELRAVAPGYVFELPQPLKQSEVRIVANGNRIGTGTLIAVGNRLGVRITTFAGGDA
ncbi:type III secretion system cytoplasmic ring protein SctQ [Cupriavidus alkaliphilus]|uniref:type III secretion system cytoplasmic ring protein SctQ n=1 Tax=Cupriavidus alkaliphilus TaxID=942866 RepID=UPI000DC27C70|nr:type III secretion system cytoplasmic ring protein SctQ [Cupriavidus alkaliphilus]RAS03172.1 type III secretion system apparatus protein YscQ/HrcQ [Cupriavidus alkaliphilus]